MTWFSLQETCPSTSATPCPPSVLAFVVLMTQYLNQSFDSRFTDSNLSGNSIANEEFDFIIVGAGTAGSVVANRLSEVKDWKILLLEAGDEEPILADNPVFRSIATLTNLIKEYSYQPEKTACGEKSSTLWSGRVMGGTSTINGRRYIRGSKQNYDDWAKIVGDQEWDWDHVLPYFKKSEDMRDADVLQKSQLYHGTGGYLTIEKAPTEDENVEAFVDGWKELGFDEVDYNAGNQSGTSRTQYMSIHGSRQSSNGAFLRPIRGRRSNLVIRTNAHAIKIIIDPSSKQTKGVEFLDLKTNETTSVYARKEVIVSCGAFVSPKVLMLSGVGPADHLRDLDIEVIKDLPVGKILNNHIDVVAFEYSLSKNNAIPLTIEDLQNDMVEWLDTREGPLSINNIGQSISYFQTKYAKGSSEPDIEVYFIKTVSENPSRPSSGPYTYYDRLSHVISLLNTTGTGSYTLNKSNPVWGDPIILTNFMNSVNIDILSEGAKLARKLADTKSFEKTGWILNKTVDGNCKAFPFESDEYLRCIIECRVDASDHTSATCKMGSKDDPSAVVDSRLRVNGIKGLRVIDASIIPILPSASLTAPVIMIGEKGSDMIKKDWLP